MSELWVGAAIGSCAGFGLGFLAAAIYVMWIVKTPVQLQGQEKWDSWL